MGVIAPNNKAGVTSIQKFQGLLKTSVSEKWGFISQTQLGYNMAYSYQNKTATKKTAMTIVKGVPWRPSTTWSREIVNWNYQPAKRVHRWWQANGAHWIVDTYEGIQISGGPQNIGSGNPYMGPNAGVMDTDGYKQAAVEAMLRLNRRKADIGTHLAESVKAVDLLADTGREFLELLRSVKRAPRNFRRLDINEKRFSAWQDRAGKIWLEWQYGWAPLAKEIHSQFLVARDGLHIGPFLHGSGRAKEFFEEDSYSYNGQSGQWKVTRRDHCKVYAKLQDAFIAKAQAMGLSDPLSVGWEIVPWSFAVDWFVPVGDFLQALAARKGLDFLGGFRSQVRHGTWDVGLITGKLHVERMIFARQANSSWPSLFPGTVDSPFNTTRVGNTLALLNSFQRKFVRRFY